MIVDRDNVLKVLQNLDGPRPLKNLFVRELGYDPEDGAISSDDWPEDVADKLAAAPTLLASTARDGRFTVIHTRPAGSCLRGSRNSRRPPAPSAAGGRRSSGPAP